MVYSSSDWSWLQDTYWYVQTDGLPALQLDVDDNSLSWIVDQTVWHITGYQQGYFWGVSATAVMDDSGREQEPRPVCFTMLGTITPEGNVHLTFIPARNSSSTTIGIGLVREQNASFTFEMQMSSGKDTLTAHWAYMARVRPEDPAWNNLPGVNISVPEMLKRCKPPKVKEDR
ncbi:MAG: hypothetical protein JNN15_21305 [Blastocatellia bacterium]|nr:hypothetical protein [Blastocatellia bacterium]